MHFVNGKHRDNNMKQEVKETEEEPLVPLCTIPSGTTVRLACVEAGHRLRGYLAALGLIVNVPIRIISNNGAGQIILSVRNSKIVLGQGMSRKILVRGM